MFEEISDYQKKLNYGVLGCAYDAFKAVGVGFDEFRYHKIFHHFLIEKGFNARYKVPIQTNHLDEKVADFEVDEIVDDNLVVELKCIQTDFIPDNIAQILTYLKATKIRVGLLINFGLHKAIPKRLIFDEIRTPDIESWDNKFFDTFPNRNLLDSIISSIKNIDNSLGIAYYSKIYQTAFSIEMRHKKIHIENNVQLILKIDNIQFSPYEIDFWLIENSFLVAILAGKHKPRIYDFLRMRSYLKCLKLHHGLIIFWSYNNFQIYGIYEP
jgi:GxxExxY protein